MNDFEQRADKLTAEWWDYLKGVNQLDTPIGKLDPMYWAMLDSSIAKAFQEIHMESEMDTVAKALAIMRNG